VSRSFKNAVPQPTQEQSSRKFKRHFNKRIRQNTKKVLEDFLSKEEIHEEDLKNLDELLEEEN
jgi:predicted transcriptional regulator